MNAIVQLHTALDGHCDCDDCTAERKAYYIARELADLIDSGAQLAITPEQAAMETAGAIIDLQTGDIFWPQ
jgi:hypothetical protein